MIEHAPLEKNNSQRDKWRCWCLAKVIDSQIILLAEYCWMNLKHPTYICVHIL